jgi:hypothetical protein
MKSALLKNAVGFGGDEEIEDFIENYDRGKFLEFVKRNADEYNSVSILKHSITDKASALIYKKLVTRCAEELVSMNPGSDGMDLPYPVGRYAFSAIGMKFPNAFLEHFSGEQAMDAYFGACYNSDRYTSEYEPGAEEILKKITLANVPWIKIANQALAGRDCYASMLSVVGVEDIIALWGEQVIGDWWRRLSYVKAKKFCENIGMMDQMAGTIEEYWNAFVGKFGDKPEPGAKQQLRDWRQEGIGAPHRRRELE